MILLTGFEPFGGDASNPSLAVAQQAAQLLQERGHQVVAAELPCVFAQAPAALEELVARHRPRVVISLGLAKGRVKLGLEKVAINLLDARISDNAGDQPIDVPVVTDGPTAYFSTLPLKAALQAATTSALAQPTVDTEISYSAGTFVCNQVFYSLMHLTVADPGIRAGFIHVPWMDQHDPHLAGHARGVAAVAELSLLPGNEPKISAGTEH